MGEPASRASEGRGRFRTLRELRDEHTRLLNAYRQDHSAAAAEVEVFLDRGRPTGEVLERADERFSAQSMLDYWATTLFRQTGAMPDVELADFDPEPEHELADSECPYPGLEPFDESQSGWFFGREAWIEAALERLESGRIVALVGEPGAGKTSLIAAGLLPRLRERGLATLPLVAPGTHPVASLAGSLREDGSPSRAAIEAIAGRSDGLLELLGRLPAPVLLAIDGLEELFTVCDNPEQRDAFVRNLLTVLEGDGRHRVILSTTPEGVTGAGDAERLRGWIDESRLEVKGRSHLGGLGAAELTRAIKSPADRIGLRYEEGLVSTLARDYLGEPLAFLQLALIRLWQKKEGNRATRDAYLGLGPGRQLVQKTADEALSGLDVQQQDLARRVFLALMPAGPVSGTVEVRPAGRRALTETVVPGSAEVVEVLRRHRLVRSNERPGGDALVEVIHAALAPSWPRLGQWVHERELKAVQDRADREAGLRRRAMRFAVAFAVAAVVAVVGWAGTAKVSRRNAVLSWVKEGLISSFVHRKPDEGLAFAAFASENGGRDPRIEAALLAVAYNSGTIRRLGAPPGATDSPGVTAFGLTGETRRAIAGSQDGSLSLWDLDRGVDPKRFERDASRERGHSDEVRSLAVSLDGGMALSGAEDGTLILWDLAAGRLARMLGHRAPMRAVAISPDGRFGVSVDRDRERILWDLATGEMVGEPKSGTHGRQVRAVAFTPSGEHFLTASEDRTIGIWETATLDPAVPLPAGGHTDEVLCVAVSPDGCRALTGSTDKHVVLWDISKQTGRTDCPEFDEPLGYRRYPIHDDRVRAVAFSPDGSWALSGGEDRRVVLWRLDENGRTLGQHRIFFGHTARVTGVEFSAHPLNEEVRRFFASSSQDGSIRLWDMEDGTELQRYSNLGVPDVHAVAVASDGLRAVLASSKGTALSLDLTTGRAAEQARFKSTEVPPAISPDLTRLVHAETVVLIVLDLDTGKESIRLQGHESPAMAVAFSAEGGHVVSGDDGGVVLAWDLSGEGETRAPILKIRSAHWFEGAPKEALQVKAVALRTEANLAVSGHERGRAFLWNSRTRELIKDLVGHNDRVRAAVFRPRHPQFATGSRDQRVILWDHKGRKVREFLGHKNEVRAIGFTPDGRFMVSGGEDREVILWHVEGGRLIARFTGHDERIMAIAVDPKGERVLSGDDGGTLIEWGLMPAAADVLASVRSRRYVRDLTDDDRKNYGPREWWRLWR